MYPAELRLTLALSLGGSAAPSPKKNCSSCCTMISWCHPAFSRELEAGQLPAGGFGSTVPGFGQVGDGGPRRSGWDERKGRRRFVPIFVHGALQQLPGFPNDHGARRASLSLGIVLHHGFEVALEPVNLAVRVCPRIAQRFLLERSDGRVVQWQNFQQARPGGNQQA